MPSNKDQEMKRQLTEKLQAEKIAAYKEKLQQEREAASAQALEKAKKERMYKDPDTGQEVDRWESVMKKADRIIHTEALSYNDWRASMSSLIALYTNMNSALAQSRSEALTNLGYLALPQAQKVYDSLMEKASGPPEVTLPTLQYLVECGDDNKLKFHSLQRFDGDSLGEEIDNGFKVGVQKWLSVNGYKPSTTEPGKWVESANGVVELTKDKFNALKNNADPQINLEGFLSGHFDLNFEERPGPSRT